MPRFHSSYLEHQTYDDWKALHVPATRLVTGTGTLEVEIPSAARALVAVLAAPTNGSLVGDTLDVYVQTRIQAIVPAWLDVIHFTQVLGNGGPVGYTDKILVNLDEADFTTGAVLGVGVKRHIFGDLWRCRWVIADGGGTHSFLFELNIIPMG